MLTDADAPIELREAAAKLLGQANKPETQAQLLQALPAAPARLQTTIAAGLAGSQEGGEKLLEAVAAGKASARLLQEKAVETPLLGSKIPGRQGSPGEADEGTAAGRPEDPGAARRPAQGLRGGQAGRRGRGQGVREELHDLPHAGQQGRQGGAAARRRRHPRPGPSAGGRAGPQPQRRSELPHDRS